MAGGWRWIDSEIGGMNRRVSEFASVVIGEPIQICPDSAAIELSLHVSAACDRPAADRLHP